MTACSRHGSTRSRAPDQRCSWAYVDARLNARASRDAEILLLEVGAPESGRLLYRSPARAAAAVMADRTE